MSLSHVLGIDQSDKSSGWCLKPISTDRYTSLRPVAHGVARNHADRVAVLEVVQREVVHLSGLLVMFEDHSGIPASKGWGTPTLLGMGAARQAWATALDFLAHMHSRRADVAPDVWRKRVLGTASGGKDACKLRAILWASARVERDISDDNEAEAIAIAEWAAFDGVLRWERARKGIVAEVPRIPKQRRRRAG